MQSWFSSDPHFGHENIIRLTNRPFRNVQEMDRSILEEYNKVIKPNDIFYLLGDFGWGSAYEIKEIRRQIKCQNIIFIWGNHDQKLRSNMEVTRSIFRSTHDILDEKINNQFISMCHYPFLEWNGFWNGAWHIFGHVHGSLSPTPGALAVDVGVDVHDYKPISFEQLSDIMNRRKKFNAKSLQDGLKVSEAN